MFTRDWNRNSSLRNHPARRLNTPRVAWALDCFSRCHRFRHNALARSLCRFISCNWSETGRTREGTCSLAVVYTLYTVPPSSTASSFAIVRNEIIREYHRISLARLPILIYALPISTRMYIYLKNIYPAK